MASYFFSTKFLYFSYKDVQFVIPNGTWQSDKAILTVEDFEEWNDGITCHFFSCSKSKIAKLSTNRMGFCQPSFGHPDGQERN